VTFSLVGYDEATESFGSIICSSSPAVAARCAHLADGAGAAHTQNITDPRLGPRLLELMAAGHPAGKAVEAVVLENPETADYRQLLAVWLPQRADYIDRALRPQDSPGYGVPGDDR
jgi:uncharacterized Ntn-hydrolase superfamily protein